MLRNLLQITSKPAVGYSIDALVLDDQTANDSLARHLQQLASDLLAMAETGGELTPAIESTLEPWLAAAERSGPHTLAGLVKQVCGRQLDLVTFLLRSRYLHSLSLQARYSAGG